MTKPMIFSYSRISSAKQANGQGLAIQREEALLKELSERYKLSIYENKMIDSGKSAFHGDHIKDGQLGWFLGAVKSGAVAPGSILVVSSLDRFSRQELKKSLHDLTAILREGIGIHSAIEERTFCNPYGDHSQDDADLSEAMFILKRAHGESKTKQARVQKLRDLAIDRHLRGERHESGFANAIKVVGNDVWWVENSDGAVRPHPVYAPLMREVALRLIEGQSPVKVATWLNAHGPECPISRTDKRQAGAWSHHVIRRLHLSRAPLGDKVINGITLPDYYPPILTEDEYYRLVDARTRRKRPKTTGKATAVSLFAGLGQVQCLHCGAGVHMNRESGGAFNYRCSALRTELACVGWSKRATQIENALLSVCLDKVWREREQLPTSRTPSIEAQVDGLEKALNNLVAQAREKGFPKILTIEISRIEAELDKRSDELAISKAEDAARQGASAGSLSERWGSISEKVLDLSNDESRHHMRELLRDSLQSLHIGRPGCMNRDERQQALRVGDSIQEEIPRGLERFILSMDIKFVDGTRRVITLDRGGVAAVAGSETAPLSAEITSRLGTVSASLLNTYAPAEPDTQAWLDAEFSDFQKDSETNR